MPSTTENTFEQIPYDHLTLVGKKIGDYGSREYEYRGQLGIYRLRIGESITDDGQVVYVYQNGRMFLNLYPTRTPLVLVGKDEEEGEFYIFRFKGNTVDVFKRKYEI